MSPFDQNIDYDAGHAIDPSIDQDDLIAFHLHELSPPQERALHRVLRTSPTLQSESIAIAFTLRTFPKQEPTPNLDAAATSNRIWQSLQPNLTPYIPAAATPFALLKLPLTRWAIPTLAGALLATTALFVAFRHVHNPTSTIATISTPPVYTSTPSAQQLPPPTTAPTTNHNLFSMTHHHARSTASALIETASTNSIPTIFPTQPPTPPIIPPQLPPSAAVTPSTLSAQPDTSHPTAATPAQPPVKFGKTSLAPHSHRPASNELTFGIFGDLAIASRAALTSSSGASATTQSVSQSPGATVGVLASFRQQFSPFRGYRLTGTYVSQSSGSTSLKISEVAGTYVVQGPRLRRLTTSAEAGAALVTTAYDSTRTFRPAAIIGIGSELALSNHWGLRAEYRAQFYKSPALFSNIAPLGVTVSSSNNTFDSDAIVGLTYLFGRTRND